MDINANSINTSRFTRITDITPEHLKNTGSGEPRKPLETAADLVTLSSSMKTSEGKIPLIVSTKGDEGLYKAKETFIQQKGIEIKDELPIINGFTTEVNEKQLAELLEKKPEGVSIFIDEMHKMIDDPIIINQKPEEVSIKTDTAIAALGIDKIWDQGFTGKDVTIAVIDTGIHPHGDFEGKIIGFKDFVNGFQEPYDDQGHGTHVAGDAAGTGAMSEGRFKGSAPDAKLVGIKSLDKHGAGRFSDIIKGIQWTIQNKDKYDIKILNMSLGGPAFQSYKDDPISQAAAKALDAGIIPVIAAGNSGPKAYTIGSPANHPEVLTVGAFDDKNTVERYDDEIAKFSSRGPTKVDNLTKPDILSPGVNITAATAYGSVLDTHPSIPKVGEHYITISGTSMATPIMAGVTALAVQARPDLSPKQIIEIFKDTARKLPELDSNQQGHGIVQPEDAMKRIMEYKA